jgi:hypothetical protein
MQDLTPEQLFEVAKQGADAAGRRLDETLERFRCYNNGTEEDILDMIDDWAEEKAGME